MKLPEGLVPTPFLDRLPQDLTENDWENVAGQATPTRVGGTVEEEYDAIRTKAGMLDFSMLPKWEITGDGAINVVNSVISRDISALAPGSIAYAAVVDGRGYMMDDVTVLVYGPDRLRITGGNWDVENVIRTYLTDSTVLTEHRGELATLSLQGPRSRETLQRLTATDLSDEAFPYYTFQTDIDLAGIPAHINRMGFTAELGYEIMVPIEQGVELWDALVGAGSEFGVIGCGGNALMVVRTEAGLIMGGLEYDEDTTPFECRMGWSVDLDKKNFHGRDALVALKGAARRTIVSLVLEADADDVMEAPVFHGETEVGVVTMSVASPELGGRTLALAKVAKGHTSVGTELSVAGQNGSVTAVVVSTPVYDPQRLKVRS